MWMLDRISPTSLLIAMVGVLLILIGLLMELKRGYARGMYQTIEVVGMFLVEMELFNMIGFMDWWPLLK